MYGREHDKRRPSARGMHAQLIQLLMMTNLPKA
jgi:hypothetical protein